MREFVRFACLLPALLAAPGIASGNPMDITLSRLWDWQCQRNNAANPRWWDQCKRGDQTAFRRLAGEYGYAIAPALHAPAETLGYAGFYLGLEGWLTIINAGTERENVWYRGTEDKNPDDVLFVSAIHVRKGLPFSFELGTSFSYVAATEQVLLGADIRWALIEGYRTDWRGYFPDIAVRGAVNRLMGEDELDMTVWSFDASISRPWAISGMMTITPFAGYQFIQIIADNSLVFNAGPVNGSLDPAEFTANPGTNPSLLQCSDAEGGRSACVGNIDGPRDTVAYLDFAREYVNRHRIFLGTRFLYEHFSVALQVGIDPGPDSQTEFGLTIGLDY